jgi:hypothetical protein|tara:strand:+ start:142 stop:579 length:438 start_codon:yes stop_codon:yes gene_type:complete
MQARKWDLDTDYEYLVDWWEQYDFGKVPKECLPPDGVIIEDKNPICAGGIYFGIGTKFAFMEWIIVDKKLGLKTAHKALNLCIEEIIKMAREKGVKLLYTATAQEALQKRYIKYHGMEIGEKSSMTFVKNLSNKQYKDLDFVKDA